MNKNNVSVKSFLILLTLATSCAKHASTSGKALGLSDVGPGNGDGGANIHVQTNFNPIIGDYAGTLSTSSSKTCVSKGYKDWSGYNPSTMEIDDFAPVFEESIVVRIIPDAEGRPVEYSFSGKISDQGCGAPKLKAVCTFYNQTAFFEKANGKTVEEIGIAEPFIYTSAQDCLVNNAASTNSYAEFMYHVINSARINDKLILTVYLQDGGGNYSGSESLGFYKYEKLMAPTTLSSN